MDTSNHTPKTIEVPLTRGQVALIDECDADLLRRNWYADYRPKYGNGGGYLARCHETLSDNKRVHPSMHRMVLERILNRPLLRTEQVDHKNLNPLDNRRENLRLATSTQNQANRSKQKNSTSGYKGVWWHKKNKKWIAHIRFNKKTRHLGSFDTPEAAHEAYKMAARELFGEFARFD